MTITDGGTGVRRVEPVLATPALSHVVLRTAHLQETVDWYTAVLGCRTVFLAEGLSAALTFDGEHHRIALLAVPEAESDPTAPGIEHIAYKLIGLEPWLGNYTRLKAEGIVPALVLHHGGTLSMYYRDPDGVQVEVLIDTMTPDQAIEHMKSEAFRANPIGVPIDPDDLVARFEAGEPLDDLLAQPPFDPEMFDAILAMGDGMAEAAKSQGQPG